MQDKHPTEIIKELNFEIHNLENLVCEQMKIFELNKFKLEKLKLRKQSLLNYLNENDN